MNTSLKNARAALAAIPSNLPRDEWHEVGRGALAAGLSLADLDDWSSSADNYVSRRDVEAAFRGIDPYGGTGAGTLFFYAKQYGYQFDSDFQPYTPTAADMAQRTAKREADARELARKREAAAVRAANLWDAAEGISEHAYLTRKQIQAHGAKLFVGELTIGGMDCNGALLLAMRLNGKISSLQFIQSSGEKRFLPDGEKGGWLIGKIVKGAPIAICEGFATGASIHEATGYAVVVAFDAGNLRKIAEAVCAKHPDAVLVLCADDDVSGTGQRKAQDAAQAVGGLLALPVFGTDRTDSMKDFNDMANVDGLAAVKRVIEGAGVPSVQLNVGVGDEAGMTWLEPLPLAIQHEVEPYPLDALPDTLRAAVEEVQAFVQAPVPLVASSAIAALSLAIQAHFDVQRASKLHSPVGLFLLTIADSGERKSTCDGIFTRAIRDYEAAQIEVNKPFKQDFEAAMGVYEAKRNGIKDKIRQLAKEHKPTHGIENELHDLERNKPIPPRIPRLIYTDSTPEKLAYSLAREYPSGGVISAEAGLVFGSHGMSGDSTMRNLATLNQLWDGNELAIDRRTSESFTVRGARLTVALQVQGATLQSFFEKSGVLARGTGFFARFLIACPESTQGQRLFTEAPDHWYNLDAFNGRITQLLNQPAPIDDSGALTPAMLTLTPDAKDAWVNYHDAIEKELAQGGELFNVRDVASKTADNATRLAALFHVFEGGIGAIGQDTFERASQVAIWHLSEARRFFLELALPADRADALRLDKWLIDYCKRGGVACVAKRHTQQHGAIRDGVRLDAALSELALLNRVQVSKAGKQIVIEINPALLDEERA